MPATRGPGRVALETGRLWYHQIVTGDDGIGAMATHEPDGGSWPLGPDPIRWQTRPSVGVETDPAVSGDALYVGGYWGIAALGR